MTESSDRSVGPRARTWAKRGWADLTTPVLVLMGAAVALNVAIGHLTGNVLRLPIYLDSIGTILVGVLAGPLAGILTGVISNLVWGLGLGATSAIPFALTAAVIGLLAGLFGAWRVFRPSGGVLAPLRVGAAGALTGLVAAIVSAPIAYFVFGGTTGGGTDLLVVIFREMGNSVFSAVLLQAGIVDPIDKTASFLLVWAILLAVPVGVRTLFPQGERSS